MVKYIFILCTVWILTEYLGNDWLNTLEMTGGSLKDDLQQ